ncbi:3-carboxymuconate cyclase [Edaphobacter acidisoli]|uniref:3-carboxymuconate cyclase n=1 Tax=Edaphobacter acidisoli TaxID=2040573 RepID=A0A916W7N9_9BACT|nr:lactonase family protein [Edaphobacter acidisoli]GGA75747.1 3-carboxymuconate cyclase [Edaphobacter acidisoli]
MLTRRRFLLLLPAATASASASAQDLASLFHRKKPAPLVPTRVYFGTDTTKGVSKGIYLSHFDSATGQLSSPLLAATTARPSYMAITPTRKHLYAVNAINDPSATISGFAIDQRTGMLREIGQVSSGGAGPAYISIDATGHAAFVANYFGSTVASFRMLPDAMLSQPVERINFNDHKRFAPLGPNTARQDRSHPHCTTISPDNRFLLVCDLGTDHISVFAIDPETAQLTTGTPYLFTNSRPGSGNRHVFFHPNGRWIYGINEIDSTIDHYLWTEASTLNPPQALLVNTGHFVKTIAASFPEEKNTAAEVAVSPDGNFLYASNRGEDTLVVYSIDQDNGRLKLVQRIPSGGKTPRHFTFDPTGEWILCGNQDSATVTVFHRNGATGRLTGPAQSMALDAVMYTLFA